MWTQHVRTCEKKTRERNVKTTHENQWKDWQWDESCTRKRRLQPLRTVFSILDRAALPKVRQQTWNHVCFLIALAPPTPEPSLFDQMSGNSRNVTRVHCRTRENLLVHFHVLVVFKWWSSEWQKASNCRHNTSHITFLWLECSGKWNDVSLFRWRQHDDVISDCVARIVKWGPNLCSVFANVPTTKFGCKTCSILHLSHP